MITGQELFDIIATHLITQTGLSIDERGKYLYRGPNGLKCAAGFLIPDEDYIPEMEGKLCINSPVKEVLQREGYDPSEVSVYQQIHDCCSNEIYHTQIRGLLFAHAKDYGFSTQVLEQ